MGEDKQIYLIRHGESEGNAGLPSENHTKIPLTATGMEQAKMVPDQLPWTPQLIAVSPFLRARQTAQPTIERYPDVPVEVWPEICEFTYLAPDSCRGTTSAERRPRVDAYWALNDPYYCDGEGAESFDVLTSRAKQAVKHIQACPQSRIVIFSHAQFIRILKDVLANPTDTVEARMARFRSLPRIQNCEGALITVPD